MNHAEAFLYDQIPPTLRSLIPTTLKTAYSAAGALIAGEPILQVPSAQDGRIIQWAVDLGFQRLVASGQWPFDHRWCYFERPTGRYLEIRPSHSVLTISQVSDPKEQPRDVRFRANKRLANQGWLWNLPDPHPAQAGERLPHILLLHGRRQPSFAHLGIPHEKHGEGFYYRTRNLMLMPHEVTDPDPELPPEETDIEAVMSLKEEIDRWRKDHG